MKAPEATKRLHSRRRGLTIVFTGNGKGKSTAAMGMCLRAWGHDYKIFMLQFIKGTWKTGEQRAIARLPGWERVHYGKGFTWLKRATPEEHRQAAREALAEARARLLSGEYDVVFLDEILYAVRNELLTLEDVLDLVAARPRPVHLILTGRGAPQELIDVADLVTEMREIKHPYRVGVKAQKGIEF